MTRCGLTLAQAHVHKLTCPECRAQIGKGGLFGAPDVQNNSFSLVNNSHLGVISEWLHRFSRLYVFVDDAVTSVYDDLSDLLAKHISHFNGVKFQIVLTCTLVDLKSREEKQRFFRSKFIACSHKAFIQDSVVFAVDYCIGLLDLFNESRSGMTISSVDSIMCRIGHYRPVRAKGYVELPAFLKRAKGVFNVRCNDSCFLFCILAGMFKDEILKSKYPGKKYEDLNANEKKILKSKIENPKSYETILKNVKQNNLLVTEGFEGEVNLTTDITNFEILNDCSINIYECKESSRTVQPIRISSVINKNRHFNLLYLSKLDAIPEAEVSHYGEEEFKSHLALITDLESVLNEQGRSKGKACLICSKLIRKGMKAHVEKCSLQQELGFNFPPEFMTHFKYKDFQKTHPIAFRAYLSFQFFTKEKQEEIGDSICAEAVLEPCAYDICCVDYNNRLIFNHAYCGEKVVDDFYETLVMLSEFVEKIIETVYLEIQPTEWEMLLHEETKYCKYCFRFFSDSKGRQKVRHHHHLTRMPYVTCCSACNVTKKELPILPVICTNFSTLVKHFAIAFLNKAFIKSVQLIPKNKESYLAIIINKNIRLLDAEAFMSGDLEMTLQNFIGKTKSVSQFPFLRSIFPLLGDSSLAPLLERKVFPSQFYRDEQDYSAKSFPDKDCFTDLISQAPIGEEAYNRGLHIFKTMCKNMKDYLIITMKRDVAVLAQIFEKFANICMTNFEIYPFYCYSISGVAQECAFFYSRRECQYEYIRSPKIIKLIEENLLGSIAFVSSTFAEADSQRIGTSEINDDYATDIISFDASLQYCASMQEYLPHSEFEFLEEDDLHDFDIMNFDENTGTGMILVVDLRYPTWLHDETKSFPLGASKSTINLDQLSDYQKRLHSEFVKVPLDEHSNRKVLLTLHDKKKLCLYYKVLRFYVSMGLEVTKYHCGIRFKEKRWLASYMHKLANLRMKATTEFESKIYKQMICSTSGKMLNIRRNLEIRLCSSRVMAMKLMASPRFIDVNIVNEDFSIFTLSKASCLFDKPYVTGYVILQLGHLALYNQYYNVLRKGFGKDNIECLQADTDGLTVSIRKGRIYEKLRTISEYFNFSLLSPKHPLYDPNSVPVAGKLKVNLRKLS